MTNEELDALVERLNAPWRREGFKPADMERAAAALQKLKQERDAIRELMNCYNLGGWTDALGPMKELAALRKKIEEAEPTAWCDVNEISFVSDDFRQNTHSSMAAYHHIPLYDLRGIKE